VSPSPSTAPAAGEFTHRQRTVIFIGLMLAMFLAALDQTILGSALPRIAAEFEVGAEISWLASAYLLAATATTPIYGKLSDVYGRRTLLRVAIVTFVAASVVCALADRFALLVAGRLVQGLGAGGLSTLALTTVADIVPPRERGRYQAYNSSAWLLASLLGPVLGGFFADYVSWRYIFWINVPVGAVALALAHFGLRALPVRRERRPVDVLGAVLIMAASTAALLVTSLGGGDVAWSSPTVLSLAVAAVGLAGLAVVQERRATDPILAPHLFTNRGFATCNAVSAFAFVGFTAYLPIYFQLVHGVSALNSGFLVLPSFLIWPLVSVPVGRIVAATGRYKLFPLMGTALSAGCVLLLAFVVTPATPLWVAVTLTGLVSVGAGAVGPVILLAGQNAVEPRDVGAATGAYSFFRNLGASFGLALLGTMAVAGMDARVKLIPGHETLGAKPGAELLHAGATAIDLAPPAIREAVIAAMAGSFDTVFMTVAATLIVAFAAVCTLQEVPLRTSSAHAERENARRAAE
jgi:EmrB/QacA subfamily drug resistance transporter